MMQEIMKQVEPISRRQGFGRAWSVTEWKSEGRHSMSMSLLEKDQV